jgi:hypothetical protein
MMSPADPTAAVRQFVERVARAYGGGTIASDADFGGGPGVGLIELAAGAGARAPGGARADIVVSLDAPSRIERWPEHIVELGRLARRALIVVVGNPERGWPLKGDGPDATELARVLWEAGRVRERAYLSVPALVAGLRRGQPLPGHVSLLVRRTARLQAFVVDTAPRTPQARRRLAVAGAKATRADK